MAETTTIELETAFADASLEMDAAGEKFRVGLALQNAVADAEADLAALDARVDAMGAPYAGPPPAPNAFNDEFASGDPNLGTRGWVFRRVTAPAGVMVRVDEVDPARYLGDTPALGALEYRSTLQGSRLYLQLPLTSDIEYALTKPVAVPVTTTKHGAIIMARGLCGGFPMDASAGYGLVLRVMLARDSGGQPDMANRIAQQMHLSKIAPSDYMAMRHALFSLTGGSEVNSFAQSMPGAPGANGDVMSVVLRASPAGAVTFTGALAKATGVGPHFAFPTAQPALGPASGFVHGGLAFIVGNSANAIKTMAPYDFVVDYARLYTGVLSGKWIGDPALSTDG